MSTLSLSRFLGEWLPKVEAEMRSILANDEPAVAAHYGMMRYHMGWVNQQFKPDPSPSGKRLRPMLCLLACSEVGGDPSQALPAAASLEILHNFSLVHDDIEDGDEVRRHRHTVWKVWGAPQAINAGDGMFALAFAAMQRLNERGVAPTVSLAALRIFTQMCLDLTEGQHLDMGFEQRQRVTVDEYMRMIQGKTAALVGASVAIGALVGGANTSQSNALQRFGQAIGLAFQIQDDILGIWGDPAVTGKAAGNDILRRKKSLPILYALGDELVGERLAALLDDAAFDSSRLDDALDLLEQAGTRAFAEQQMRSQHDLGVAALHEALGEQADGSALLALTESLLHRAH
jgi:geranylgeranyl diphosphate synthase type I